MKKVVLLSAVSLLGSFAVSAQELSASEAVSTAVSAMKTTMIADITIVGLALISAAAVAVGLKWVKAALFG